MSHPKGPFNAQPYFEKKNYLNYTDLFNLFITIKLSKMVFNYYLLKYNNYYLLNITLLILIIYILTNNLQ